MPSNAAYDTLTLGTNLVTGPNGLTTPGFNGQLSVRNSGKGEAVHIGGPDIVSPGALGGVGVFNGPLEVNSVIRQNMLYLSGGEGWSSLSYNAYHTEGQWVFPHKTRPAVTLEMDDANNGKARFQVWSTTTAAKEQWVPRLSVDGETGNVGVGTTDPQAALHVTGNAGLLNLEGADHAYIQWYPKGMTAGRKAWIGYGDSGTDALTLANDAGRMHIWGTELLYLLNKSGVIIGKEWGGTGQLSVEGAINAANSDFYFTKIDHNHTGLGNQPGYAAIENAQDYGALMILGRSTDSGRIVKLWDYLEVCGSLAVNGGIFSGKPLTPDYAENISVRQSDAKLLLYDYGGDNWAGIGVDTGGLIWIRTGTAEQNLIRIGPAGLEMVNGDIILTNADCAEDFAVVDSDSIDAGTVMVIEVSGALKESDHAYDKRVAGVISGAGELKPGITLGKQQGQEHRLPLALVGKVYCKADAQFGPIEVGDLLTTSPTPGHAMKASDPVKAFGAVIGKALGSMEAGTGLIPIIVALQ